MTKVNTARVRTQCIVCKDYIEVGQQHVPLSIGPLIGRSHVECKKKVLKKGMKYSYKTNSWVAADVGNQ